MSLPALALLYAATGCLRAVAPDWLRIEASPREPLAELAKGKQALVAVYCGDQLHPITRRRMADQHCTVELAVQVLLPAEIAVGAGPTKATLKGHSVGLDVVTASVHRLIERAFTVPGEAGTWPHLFQGLVMSHPEPLEVRPFLAEVGDVRVPAVDFTLGCKLVPSPRLGEAPAWHWGSLVALMKANERTRGAAAYVEALIAGEEYDPWTAELALHGLSIEEGAALGLGAVRVDGAPAGWPEAAALTFTSPGGETVVTADPPP